MSFRLLYPLLRKNNYLTARISRVHLRTLKTAEEKEVNNEPIQYTTSKAGEWLAKYSTSGKEYYEYPRSQSTIIVFSMAIFLIYFCVLREENDLDDWLRDIETGVPLKLEEGQLRQQIIMGKKEKRDVSTYELRLQKVLDIQEKVKAASQPR